jgi:hypothetical protein
MLPYPDPLRRRRARRAARALVRCDPWPDTEATTSDFAQLMLVRLLALQRETRRALRWRLHDASALLTRASVETCLSGLYWIYDEPDVQRMHAHTAESFRRLLSPIAASELVPQALVDEVAGMLGAASRQPPNLSQMARGIGDADLQKVASDLYARLYAPLSICYAHPTGFALNRHVGRDDRLRSRPDPVWTARSMRHTVDACMAVLAIALAKSAGADADRLVSYADEHMTRAVSPIAAMGGRAALDGVNWSAVPRALRVLDRLRRYYESGQAARDPFETRKSLTREAFDEMLNILGARAQLHRDDLIDHFAELTARSVDGEPSPPPS